MVTRSVKIVLTLMAKKQKITTPRSENLADDGRTGSRAATKRLRVFVKANQARLAKFAATWLILAAVELSLNFIIRESVLRNPELPLGARLLLFCHALTTSALFLGVFTISLFLSCQLFAYCFLVRPASE